MPTVQLRQVGHASGPTTSPQDGMKRNGIPIRLLRYVDAGAEYYESQYQHRALRSAKRRAAQLGYQMVPMSDGKQQDTGLPLNPAAGAV